MFGWKLWDIHLAKFKKKQINILEIGVYKGDALEKFAQVFLDSEPNSHYYGIDTWEGSPEYVGIDFKEIEKKTLEKKANSPSKARIHLIKQESTLALPMLLSKGLEFDIIFIDASHVAKDVLYDSVLCMRLLKEKGVIIFDDYLWEKLEPSLFTPKPAIDSVLEIYKDVIDILYVGYQVIIQKVPPKFSARKTVRTVISGFSDLLNKFWKENSARIILELTNQKLPELQFHYKEKEGKTTLEKKVRALPSEIRLIYTTNDFEKIRKDIESKGKKLRIERFLNHNNYYAIRNLLHDKKTLLAPNQNRMHLISKDLITEKTRLDWDDYIAVTAKNKIKTSSVSLDFYTDTFDIKKIKEFLDVCKKIQKTSSVSGSVLLIYPPDLKELYERNILVQFLSLKHLLNKGGRFSIVFDFQLKFVNDFLVLLQGTFKKVKFINWPNNLYGYCFLIEATSFEGIPDSIYDGILRRLSLNKDMEIVSLFKNSQQIWGFEENPQLKTILKEYDENKDIILNHLDKFRILQTRRTLDDLYTYVLK